MFGGMDLGKLMKQAQDMQKKMERVKEDLRERVVEASAGGAVVVRFNGAQELLDIQIQPDVLKEEASVVQDLVVAAVNEGLKKAKALAEQEMGKVAGGLGGLPGMGM
jgi:DNA-binding YbaB/EbfC family protein